jgi:integrase
MPRPRLFRPALKKSAIDAARKAKRDQFLWDGREHGLGVKITPAGSKIFILQKTVRGRVRRITLGKYGDITLEDARIEARKLNGVIAANRDPIAEREEATRREQLEKNMQDLWDRYAAEVITGNKASTIAKKLRMWKRRIEPSLGRLKIKDVSAADASEVVRAPLRLDGATGQAVGGKGEGGNLYRLLHHMFRKAIEWGMRPRELGNPLEGVTEPKVTRRERLLAAGEMSALLREFDRVSREKTGHAQIVAAIKAASLTGARISELLTLRWEDVRPEERELHLRDTKTGFSSRPVSAEALAVIQSVERMPGVPFVFRSIVRPQRPLSYNTVEKAFHRIAERAGINKPNCPPKERVTLHTLRHWFTTMTANSVTNPRVGMKLTGHKSHAAYMTYVHAEKEQAHALAAQLSALTAGLSQTAAPVVDHPARSSRAKGKRA